MDNDKKLFEGLLKADGIDPAGATESERTAFGEMLDEQSKPEQSKPGSRHDIWRVIMKSKITKLAAAAVIIIAALIGINRFGRSINLTTIALAEIVEMMELQPWIHAIANIRSPEGEEQEEHWIAFKRSIEVSKHTNGNIRYADSGRDELYLYDANKNTIIVSSMSDQYAMPRRTPLPESPIELIEQMITNVKEQGETTLSSETIFQDNREIEILHLVCHIPTNEDSLIKQEVTLTVDAETHLLENLQMIVMEEGKELATAYIEFRYPTEGPADIYLAGAPHDAKVINRTKKSESASQIRIDYQIAEHSQSTNQNTLMLYGDLTMELVYIPAGEFYMGSAVDEIGYPERLLETYHKSKKKRVRELKHPSSEDPQHLVKIENGFYLSRYEVTCEQFRKFKNEYRKGKYLISSGRKHKSYELDADNQPAGVSLKDARKFCEWLGEKTGLNVALPCEAEWEYACRGGTQSRFYWGDSEKEAEQYANLADISYENESPDTLYTLETNDGNVCLAPVGQYLPNAFGLYDMIGNISEWVDRIYSDNAFSIDPDNKIFGKDKADNQEQYCRGGSWQADIINGRCSSRWIAPKDDMPGTHNSYIGFRVLIKEP